MLNLSQLQRNFIFVIVGFFLFIILFNVVEGFEIGVSPPIININGTNGEKICNNITLIASEDYDVGFDLSDAWSDRKRRSKDITKFNINSENYNVETEYPSNITLEYNITKRACFTFRSSGYKQGLLFFDAKERNLKLGVWIVGNIYENDTLTEQNTQNNYSFLGISKQSNVKSKVLLEMIIFQTILVVLFGFICYFYLRKRVIVSK